MSLEATARLLLQPLGLVLGGGLLRIGRDLDGELHRLLERVARALVDGLGRLDVDRGDDEAVGGEAELVAHLAVLVEAKDARADDLGAVLVEVVKLHRGDGAAHARGNGLAEVADKVGDGEEARGLVRRGAVLHLKVPVVAELELEAGVVGRLDGDNVCAKVGPEQEAEDNPDELPKRPNTTQAKHEQNVRNNRAHYWYMEDEPPFSHVPAGHRTQLDRTPEPAW